LAQLTPNQKPFCGCWGCLASLRSCKHLPARCQPPRGWADGGRPRGIRPDHFRVPPVDPAPARTNAPMWCDGGGLRGRAGRYIIGDQIPDSSAPARKLETSAVGELVRRRILSRQFVQIQSELASTWLQPAGYRVGLSDQRFLVWLGDGPGLEGDGFPGPNERRGRRPLLQSILGNRG
jgi:hypothetical protein